MRKSLVLSGLVLSVTAGLALAQGGAEGTRPDRPPQATELRGEIVSVSKTQVVIESFSEEDQSKRVEIALPGGAERQAEMRLLLAQGIGNKAELLCRKRSSGSWQLVRIEGIEGVELPQRPRDRRDFGRGPDRLPGEGPERGPAGPGGGGPERMGPDRERGTLRHLRFLAEELEKNPSLRQELKELAKEDMAAFRRRVRELAAKSFEATGRSLQDYARRKWPEHAGPAAPGRMAQHPEAAEIRKVEQQTIELAKQYHQAEGQDREELGKQLREALAEAFDKKAEAQEIMVQRLEKQLDTLRERLKKRGQNREAIIQGRFAQLTGQEDDLSW